MLIVESYSPGYLVLTEAFRSWKYYCMRLLLPDLFTSDHYQESGTTFPLGD
jgi:hypothetical protein